MSNLRKIARVAFRVLWVVVALELILRLGGPLRWAKEQIAYNQAQESFRVLCIGGCELISGWPTALTEALQSQGFRGRIEVHNKGAVGGTLDRNLPSLDHHLEQSRPHVVVTMMHLPRGGTRVETSSVDWALRWLNELRLYHFLGLLKRETGLMLSQRWARLGKTVHPSDFSYYHRLAQLFIEEGEAEEAEAVLRSYLEKHPEDPDAYEPLITILYEHRSVEHAMRDLESTQELTRKVASLFQARAESEAGTADDLRKAALYWAASRRGLENARELTDRYLKTYPQDSSLLAELAAVYRRIHRFHKVVPRDFEAREAYARAYEQLLVTWAEVFPRAVEPYARLVEFQTEAERLQDATDSLMLVKRRAEQVLGSQPEPQESFQVYQMLAASHQTLERFDEALEHKLSAFAVYPEGADEDFLITTMLLHEELGQTEEARRWLERSNSYRELTLSGETWRDYLDKYAELQKKVLASGAKLVIVSYPFESVRPVQYGLEPNQQTSYVDCGEIFDQALRSKRLSDLFKPLKTQGDLLRFTTKEGNTIMATSIAKAVLGDLRRSEAPR